MNSLEDRTGTHSGSIYSNQKSPPSNHCSINLYKIQNIGTKNTKIQNIVQIQSYPRIVKTVGQTPKTFVMLRTGLRSRLFFPRAAPAPCVGPASAYNGWHRQKYKIEHTVLRLIWLKIKNKQVNKHPALYTGTFVFVAILKCCKI